MKATVAILDVELFISLAVAWCKIKFPAIASVQCRPVVGLRISLN